MRQFVALAALSLGSIASAQSVARTCPQNNLCYSLNIPESTANTGNGDIYFQISAPTQYEWVALGQGSSMSGSNIFVVYTSADGQNVTVSPRLGTGHVEPQHDTAARITILGGSGVQNGIMTANVRCSNCQQWQGGSMDFTGTSSNWIHASKSGQPMNTDDVAAGISYHDDHAPFEWGLTQARGGNSVNPFAANAEGGTTPTSSNNSTGGQSASFAGRPFGGDMGLGHRVQLAHGIIASIAFVALFPIGGIMVRVANFTGLIWMHAAFQIFAYAFYIAAFGLGIYLATETDHMSDHHPIIGIVLFVILFFQPFSGWLHHIMFKKSGGRTLWSWEHIGIGRIAIILGMINGGLGIQLAGDVETGYKAAYAVCAAVMGVVYIAAIVYGEMKRRRAPSPPSYDNSRMLGSHDGSPDGRNPYSKPEGGE